MSKAQKFTAEALRDQIRSIDEVSQSAFGQISALARVALASLETGSCAVDVEVMAGVLSCILDKAADADNDQATSAATGRNPGKEKAEQAARAVRGVATWPEDLPSTQSDFNDLHANHGLEAVRACVDAAIKRMQAPTHKPDQESVSGRLHNSPGPVWDR